MDQVIRCFGLVKTFGYDQIGGTDSFFRRLGLELAARGRRVEFVHYGASQEVHGSPAQGLTIHSYRTLAEALSHLRGGCGPVFVNAVRATDRPRFMRFRRANRRKMKFVIVYSFHGDTWARRTKHFLEALLYPYSGGALCMSERLARTVSRYRCASTVLLPPVDDAYFAARAQRRPSGRIVVAYIGRLEDAKGAPEAVGILERLAAQPRFDVRAYVYAWQSNREARALLERLRATDDIQCQMAEHSSWTPGTDAKLAGQLAEIDVLLLPYRTVSSSIDTPLLLLEGMAAGCCCMTRPLGDIPSIYGQSAFLVEDDDFTTGACELLGGQGLASLQQERERVMIRIDELEVDTGHATDRLLGFIDGLSPVSGGGG